MLPWLIEIITSTPMDRNLFRMNSHQDSEPSFLVSALSSGIDVADTIQSKVLIVPICIVNKVCEVASHGNFSGLLVWLGAGLFF